MKKLNSILAILIMVVFLGACSDDDTSTNPTDGTFSFPLASGNTWTYDVYALDENESKTDEKLGTNKIIIGSAVTLDDRSGYLYNEESTIIEEDEDEPTLTAISSDEDGLYMYFDSFSENEENPIFGFSPGWVKMIDFKNNSWESFNMPIDVTEDGVTTKGSLKMIGSSVGKVDVTYKGKSYSAMKFKTTTSINITITYGEGSFSINNESDSYLVIISGIGMFEVKSIETDEETNEKGGEIEILIDHTLN